MSFLDDRTQVALLAKAEADSLEAMRSLLTSLETKSEAAGNASGNATASTPSRSMNPRLEPNTPSTLGATSYSSTSTATFLPVMSHTAPAFADASHTLPQARVWAPTVDTLGESSNAGKSPVTTGSNPSNQSRFEVLDQILLRAIEMELNKPSHQVVPDACEGIFSRRSISLCRHLNDCASAVARLNAVLVDANRDLLARGSISISTINRSFRSARRAFKSLADAESENKVVVEECETPPEEVSYRISSIASRQPNSLSISRELSLLLEAGFDPLSVRTQSPSKPPHFEGEAEPPIRDQSLESVEPCDSGRMSRSDHSRHPAQNDHTWGDPEDSDDTECPAGFETVDDLVRKWTYAPPG